MIYAVIDTNVIVSALFTKNPETAIKEAMSGHNPNKVYDNVDDMINDILNEE